MASTITREHEYTLYPGEEITIYLNPDERPASQPEWLEYSWIIKMRADGRLRIITEDFTPNSIDGTGEILANLDHLLHGDLENKESLWRGKIRLKNNESTVVKVTVGQVGF